MPPLRERKEDIPALAQFFIKKYAAELKKKVEGLTPDAQKLLLRYNFPGNIRELENTIERAALLADSRFIEADDLRLGEASSSSDGTGGDGGRQAAADRHRARGDRAAGAGRSAADVELGAEGRRGAAAHQPAGDELQDQGARHRAAALAADRRGGRRSGRLAAAEASLGVQPGAAAGFRLS